MKRSLLLLAFVFVSTIIYAQIENPVEWKFTSKKINTTTYEIELTANLEDGWHIYSQSTPAGGPLATSIVFRKNPLAKLNGGVKEKGKLEKHFEPLFGVEVRQFSDKVQFVQLITIKPGIKTIVNGSIEYMTCNEEKCLPAKTIKFSVPLQ